MYFDTDNVQKQDNQQPEIKNEDTTAIQTDTNQTDEVQTDEKGFSTEELNDPNKIKVTISDTTTPIVVLFGPPSCGKTMTLVRLARYLQNQGYTVKPEKSFRPSYDKNYIEMCNGFNTKIYSDDAAESTKNINFMLIRVFLGSRPICQILEGPGEYYFDPKKPADPFPKYVNAIINSNNRKLWAVLLEPDETNTRMDTPQRALYTQKIAKLKSRLRPMDKVMFVLNKVDETLFVRTPGNIDYGQAKRQVEQWYQNIFEPFKNVNPITKLWKPYNCDFIAFQTGDFSKANDGTLTFQEGSDIYPRNLWQLITKKLKG